MMIEKVVCQNGEKRANGHKERSGKARRRRGGEYCVLTCGGGESSVD